MIGNQESIVDVLQLFISRKAVNQADKIHII